VQEIYEVTLCQINTRYYVCVYSRQ